MFYNNDYINAYTNRRKEVHQRLIDFSTVLKQNGYKVYAFRSQSEQGSINLIHVRKNNMQTYIWYAESCYCWRIDGNNYSHPSYIEGGSDYKTFPFGLKEVEQSLVLAKPLQSFYVEI